MRAVLVALFLVTASCVADSPTTSGSDLSEILVTPPTASMQSLGEVVTAQATPRAADGTQLAQRVQWSSSNVSVVTVLASGDLNESVQITARGNGTALVSASAEGVTGGVQITVEQSVASFDFVVPPQDGVLGQPSADVQVAALDPGRSPVLTASGPVTLDVANGSPGAIVGGQRTASMTNGVASFADVRMTQLGIGYRLNTTWDGRAASSTPFSVVTGFDLVRVTGGSGDAAGFLIDGFRSGSPLNDFAVVSDQLLVEVGIVDATTAGNNEVVAFSRARRPSIQPAAWSAGVDTVGVTLEGPLEVDLTVWMVQGPFSSQSTRALNAVNTTRSIWNLERAGIVIDSVEVIDATEDPDATQLLQLTLCNSKDDLENLIGKKEGTINLYYVETVDGGTDRGRACPIGGDHAIMAERSGDELLSHEIGHLLSLTHIDGITQEFDRTNVMHSASSSRRYLTEGQIFRQHFDPNSATNRVFGLRTDEERACPRDTASASCPAIAGRVWSDGSFGPTLASGEGPPTLTTTQDVDARSPAAAVAHRWVEVSCEMEANEGLTQKLLDAGPEAVDALVQVVEWDPDPTHKRAAVDGLAVIGGTQAEGVLLQLARDPELARVAQAARRRLRDLPR